MPNMWKSDGTPAYESEGEHEALRNIDIDWSPRLPRYGYVESDFTPYKASAEEDFAEPYTEEEPE